MYVYQMYVHRFANATDYNSQAYDLIYEFTDAKCLGLGIMIGSVFNNTFCKHARAELLFEMVYAFL